MSKIMNTTPMGGLLRRMSGEWQQRRTIYDIPEALIRRVLDLERASPGFTVNGLRLSLPVGPAAGPHTQIAPNLVAAWLAGSRVFELKTVQENDRLEIAKPCIDALDEGHNVEWSTELRLEEARSEYLNGWIAIQLLSAALGDPSTPVMFNMSVGYTLDGIKGQAVDAFIEGMLRPAGTEAWEAALAAAAASLRSPDFASAFGKDGAERALARLATMPDRPIHSATLSTMHGCPPDEIERIGAYLIEEKHLDTYIKLNPTLLGYDRVRDILDRTSWQAVTISRPSFEHDLQFDAALGLLASLDAKAAATGRSFGIKLSNTLANANDGRRLPGDERYMSGRALFPITATLAAELAKALPRARAFSYCGGVSALNVYDCMRAGLGPLTVATDILKPGGYLRLEPMAREAVRAMRDGLPPGPDASRLEALAAEAIATAAYHGDFKQGETRIDRPLPLTDCFAAPCVEACPARQQAPAYMKALAAGQADRALAIILEDNPLPFITGILCDHQCMYACARVDYEGPVAIRSMKLACARASSLPVSAKPRVEGRGRTAVFGAGPGGLATAHYLALHGYPVTVFDTAPRAGGIPAHVIPGFRIDPEDIAKDVDRIGSLGADFVFNWSGSIDLEALRAEGFTSFVLATGAPLPRPLELKGQGIEQVDALDFLAAVHRDPDAFGQARAVAVCGGGNTAMDAARAAVRLAGRPSVSILYRRGLAEMPADREEYLAALADGVDYHALTLPEEAVSADGGQSAAGGQPAAGGQSADGELPSLVLREMRLGEPDASGRRSPQPGPSTRRIDCDLLIAAVGELPDRGLFESLGLEVTGNGRPQVDPESMLCSKPDFYAVGDARRGPASIIAAAADGRQAAYSILAQAGLPIERSSLSPPPPDYHALARRGELLQPACPQAADFAQIEAERCLSCGAACLRCVEVCPNRANVALPVRTEDGLRQAIQIVHVDALCNECGNCGFFCPYHGEPYTGKPTLFDTEAELLASSNAGFAFIGPDRPELLVRTEAGAAQTLRLAYLEWSQSGSAEGPETALLGLARQLYQDHRYLIATEDLC